MQNPRTYATRSETRAAIRAAIQDYRAECAGANALFSSLEEREACQLNAADLHESIERMLPNRNRLKVLVACESSGTVREAFRRRGHVAFSCDLLPADDGSEWHVQGDAVECAESTSWDLMIHHAPCTRLANSGVRWLAERDLWDEMRAGAAFFNRLQNMPHIPVVIGENPIPHKHAAAIIGRPTQYTNPCDHGDPYTKKTGLWIRDARGRRVAPTNPVEPTEGSAMWKLGPSAERWKLRSKFPVGIAEAIAETWGGRAS